MRFFLCVLLAVAISSADAFTPLQPITGTRNGRIVQTSSYQLEHRRCCGTSILLSSAASEEEDDDDDEDKPRPVEDYTGKTIFQRTFYRLSPDSQVQLPNSIMLEERLRFVADTNNEGYILPVGPRYVIYNLKLPAEMILLVPFRLSNILEPD
jgi:hypothetical protein